MNFMFICSVSWQKFCSYSLDLHNFTFRMSCLYLFQIYLSIRRTEGAVAVGVDGVLDMGFIFNVSANVHIVVFVILEMFYFLSHWR